MRKRTLLVSVAYGLTCVSLQAQYQGNNLLGDLGLGAGSQPGPGIYVSTPLFYGNRYSGLRGAQGQDILTNLDLNIGFITIPAIAVTTPFKIFGATYGFQAVPAVLNQALTVASTNFQRSRGFGFTDLYVQPVSLGWRAKRADFLVGYAFFAPTGGDHGLHMWVNEPSAGATVYFDADKKWRASTAAFFDLNQKKRTQDIKVGDILTLEGGVGRSFLKGAGSAGLAYAAQWKVTHDRGTDIPTALPITNGRNFAIGPEITVPVYGKGANLVLVGFRYEWQFGAKTNFEGQTLVASITFAHLILPGR